MVFVHSTRNCLAQRFLAFTRLNRSLEIPGVPAEREHTTDRLVTSE